MKSYNVKLTSVSSERNLKLCKSNRMTKPIAAIMGTKLTKFEESKSCNDQCLKFRSQTPRLNRSIIKAVSLISKFNHKHFNYSLILKLVQN